MIVSRKPKAHYTAWGSKEKIGVGSIKIKRASIPALYVTTNQYFNTLGFA